ncbi:hypothetical protein DFH29DRAFT_1007276 [Suillus ampliporus]|nr:hypothetical protein DFH29DRAFT_1007276 [Suillus ampliporus]
MSLEDDPMGLQSHNFGPHVSHKHDHGVQFDGGLDSPAGGTWSDLEGSSGVQPEHSEERTQEIIDYFPGAAETYRMGYTFLTLFNSNEYSVSRKTNIYYPFSCRKDWEVASWLLHSGLSMGKIDTFLLLEMDLPLSFSSAKELRGRAEMLPSGPCWMSQVITISHPTKSPVILYWHDPLECITSILNHPLFHDQLDFTPHKVYTTAQRLCQIYTEWISGDDAWNMQSALPKGATLLGMILSSDKTNISVLTGDCVAHPLFISLANICMNTQMKPSSNSFLLTALLLVLKFIHKNKRLQGVMTDRLKHQCLDIVLAPLKQAAQHGVMLSDPVGDSRYCYTGLVSYIVDMPEAMMLSTIGGKMSPITMAMYKQFGDSFCHEPQMKSTTLAQLVKFCLNGVDKPFWRDWPLAEPSHFFTPEPLHHLHREFWDHNAKWLIYAVGDLEMDFHFSILQPITGFQHFKEGISKLKQVAGRCHQDIQCSIIAINDNDLTRISAALDEFHVNKDAIIAAGVCRGKGNKIITNWHILKLELMQSVVPSIQNSGVTSQWSTDSTKHAHITEIKDPTQSSNNNNYDPQIYEKQKVTLTGTEYSSDDEDDAVVADTNANDDIPAEFLSSIQHVGGPRRAGPNATLPFEKVQVWFKLHLQSKGFHDEVQNVRPAQTLNCASPSEPWTCGHYDTVIVNTDVGFSWPSSGLLGHTIAQVRLVICPLGKMGMKWLWPDRFLTYVHHFDIIPQGTNGHDPGTQMHLLKRAKHSCGTWMGDVVSVSQLQAPVNIVARFGAAASDHLTAYNSLEHVLEFWLNRFWDKSTYFPLSL